MHENIVFQDLHLIDFTRLSEEEGDRVLRIRNDDRIRRWMTNSHGISPEEHHAFLKKLGSDKKNHYYTVNSPGLLGVVSLTNHAIEDRRAHLGIYVDPELQGRGLGSRCLAALLHLAFDVYSLHTLKLEVISNNTSAIRLYAKTGFQEEGRLRDYFFRDDAWLDLVCMSIDENSYRSQGK